MWKYGADVIERATPQETNKLLVIDASMLRRTGGLSVIHKVNDKVLRETSSEIFPWPNTSGPFTMLFSLFYANNFCSVNAITNLFCLLLGMIPIFKSSTTSPASLCVCYFLYFSSHSSLADGDMTCFLCSFLKGRYFLFLSRKKRDVLILNFFLGLADLVWVAVPREIRIWRA